MIIESTFHPPKWLSSCHLQTILPVLSNSHTTTTLRHELIDLPDGDFLHLTWADENLNYEAPLVILLHGIAGNLNSHYIRRVFNVIHKAGYRSVLVHFRGAGGSPNRMPKAYHSGTTDDLNYIINYFNQIEPFSKKSIIGFSLGGGVLLKWLGEAKHSRKIDLSIAISVPFDLSICSDTLNHGVAKVYQAYLLRDMKYLILRKLHLVGPVIGINDSKLMSINTIREYDELITAPLYGFDDADDYYRKTSCRLFLKGITNKTVIIHSKDDPFMSSNAIPKQAELSKTTQLELSEKGGHLGFINGDDKLRPIYWLPQRLIQYLDKEFKE